MPLGSLPSSSTHNPRNSERAVLAKKENSIRLSTALEKVKPGLRNRIIEVINAFILVALLQQRSADHLKSVFQCYVFNIGEYPKG